jgi:hypothetical protein
MQLAKAHHLHGPGGGSDVPGVCSIDKDNAKSTQTLCRAIRGSGILCDL